MDKNTEIFSKEPPTQVEADKQPAVENNEEEPKREVGEDKKPDENNGYQNSDLNEI